MRPLQNRPVFLVMVVLGFLLAALYAAVGIPSKEGFNPSDDGVILAQSYRLLQGEVPHLDFISVRPVGSAVMHAVSFFSPLSLELSARWLVLLEYFIYSVLLVLILMGSWFRGMRRRMYLLVAAGSVLVIFVLNQNHYNLFPWTTIDALFWFSAALYGWFRLKAAGQGRGIWWLALIIFGITCSVLSRQTFLLPGLLLGVRVAIWELAGKGRLVARRFAVMVLVLLIGALPGLVYAGMLTIHHSWPEFFRQMTGRTELWDTGFVRFWYSFWHSPVLILFGLALLIGLLRIWTVESGRDANRINLFLLVIKLVSFAVKILLAFAVFIKPELLFGISHAFFWMLVLDIFLLYLHAGRLPGWSRPVWWVLLVSWTSAVSVGDNAPVFALGWLAGTALLLQLKDFGDRFYRRERVFELVAAGALIASLVVLSVVAQLRVNYRDLSAKELTRKVDDLFPGLTGIRLSPEMADYLSEINYWYNRFGSPRGRFAVWPNNALIYPLLDSPNPFELDWMQQPEYAGSEDRLEKSVGAALRNQELFILVEKWNVKRIAGGRVPLDTLSADYGYLPLLDSLAERIPEEGAYFRVYHTK